MIQNLLFSNIKKIIFFIIVIFFATNIKAQIKANFWGCKLGVSSKTQLENALKTKGKIFYWADDNMPSFDNKKLCLIGVTHKNVYFQLNQYHFSNSILKGVYFETSTGSYNQGISYYSEFIKSLNGIKYKKISDESKLEYYRFIKNELYYDDYVNISVIFAYNYKAKKYTLSVMYAISNNSNHTTNSSTTPTIYNINVWQQHNFIQGNSRGMLITVKFNAKGLLNNSLKTTAWFYLSDNRTPLQALYGGGQVYVSTNYTPVTLEGQEFTAKMYLPYNDLYRIRPYNGDLSFNIEIDDMYGKAVGNSNNIRFHVNLF